MSTLRFSVLLAATLLGGCFSLGGTSRELAVFQLESKAAATTGDRVTWQLVVDEPVADDALSGSRIVVAPSDGERGVLRGARWSDRTPALMQTLLVRGFEDSGRIAGVGRISASVRGDFGLISELRAFQIERRGAREEAVVVLSVKLVRYATNDVLAARVFDARTTVGESGSLGVAAAFQSAVDQLVPAVVDWTLEVGEANRAADGPRAR
jgi:cholesterol transport system auxiliary component